MDANVAPPILWRAMRREDAAVAAVVSDASDGSDMDELVEDTDVGTTLGGKCKGDGGGGEKETASVAAAERDTMVRFFIAANTLMNELMTDERVLLVPIFLYDLRGALNFRGSILAENLQKYRLRHQEAPYGALHCL